MEDDDEELDRIRQLRLEHMRASLKGRINEILTKEEFLSASEDPVHMAIIYIYEDLESVQVLNEGDNSGAS